MGTCTTSSVLTAIAACALVACAQIAGLEDPDPVRSGPGSIKAPTSAPVEQGDAGGTAGRGSADDDNDKDFEVRTAFPISFPAVVCGQTKATEIILWNKTGNAREFEVRVPEGAPFRIVAPGGDVSRYTAMMPVGRTTSVTIVAAPTAAGDAIENILIQSGSSFVTVPVMVKGVGGKLEWSTATADVGDTPLNTQGTTTATLKNVGTADVMITDFLGQTSDFAAGPKGFVLAPDASAPVTLSLTSKSTISGGQISASITPIATDLCSAAPPVVVTGKRIDTKITVTGADWGKRDCNTASPGSASVVVKNYSPNIVKWTLKGTTTLFTRSGSGGSSGQVPAATGSTPGQTSIAFNAPALTATLGEITEAVTVTVEPLAGGPPLPPPSGGDHTVTLRVDVRGAIVEIAPSMLEFTASVGGPAATNAFTITNTGNESARLNWAFLRTSGDAAWLDLPQTTTTYPGNGNKTTRTITYRPTGEASSATLTPSESRSNGAGRICNGPLGAVVMVGGEPAGEE